MGLETAKAFASEGARVAVMARSLSDIEAAESLLEHYGAAQTVGLVADLTDTSSVSAAFTELGKAFSDLNALVNMVGPPAATYGETFEDFADEHWSAAFNQGVMGPVRVVRCALPLLRAASWARVVNVTAMSTKHQSPSLAAYTAAKAALASVSKNMSRTLAKDGILVNAVAPGSFATDGFKQWLRGKGHDEDYDPDDLADCNRWVAEYFNTPADLGRVGEPRELASAIVFLASRAATFITGAHLNVDGGTDFC
jgi:3-oxoacyl-[acyl-carrier protein] reductase